MEVESRVSVQAMRGKFEQKPEDSPLTCVPSSAPRLTTSPGRARASSFNIKDQSSSCDNAKLREKLTKSADNETECVSRNVKHSPNSVSKTKSIFSEIVSPMLTGSKVAKVLSPKRHSVDIIKDRRLSSEIDSHEVTDFVETTPSRKISETSGTETKPSVVRRIPVFKSFNGGLSPEDRTVGKTDVKECTGETPSKKDKFLGHIRSRSHGNFMIKRDSSVERNGSFRNKVENAVQSENGHTDLHDKKSRQKSSDNLYGYRDSKCSSPFEGKQKIVANVVKNMKNKEKPKVLRKFSFSSKIEKELKNKKEKASPKKANEVKVGKQSHGLVPSIAKMEAIAKSTVKERKSSVTGSTVCISTVSVAKAVADIALVRSSTRSPETSDGVPSPCEETSPPARPPRRRSTASGLSSHKKGMAPSPPGPPQNSHKKETVPSHRHNCDRVPAIDIVSEQELSPDSEKNRNQDFPNYYKSSDSLISPQSSDISRENSPVMISQNSPLLQKTNSKFSINVPELSRLYAACEEDNQGKIMSKNENSVKSITRKSPEIENMEQSESECLPAGPPPKKPPRTFAYDIYRSGKDSKSEEDMSLKENGEGSDNLEIANLSSGPIYAVPLKKKKPENKPTLKPPVRSNSDLSKRDLIKPSVAPKPRHILNKVKRASVVDPLSCAEKGEEAAMTSEFQRQAHIRYSLRRPKKPPPAPPLYSEPEGSIVSDKVESPSDEKALAKNHSSLNQSLHSSKKNNESSSSPLILNDSRSSPLDSINVNMNSRYSPDSLYQSVNSDDNEDEKLDACTFRVTSHSSYNLHVPTDFQDNQPLSLGHCPMDTSSDLTGIYRKRSMSDETLYKGSRYGDEPIYAMPIFASNKGSRGHNRQRELHYMCSVLFTDEEEGDAGRDGGSGRGNTKEGDTADGNKVKSSIISAWKKEFRQSCRQVQNKIKKTVNR